MNISNVKSPNFFLGIAEAMQASIDYETKRGRKNIPQPNFGLIKYILQTQGHRAMGACWVMSNLTNVPLSEVVQTRKEALEQRGLFDLAPVGGGLYLTGEKLPVNF